MATPPPDAIRGRTLTPLSPRPVHALEPSSITKLEEMDLVLHQPASHLDRSSDRDEEMATILTEETELVPGSNPFAFTYPAVESNGTGLDGQQAGQDQGDTDGNNDYTAMSLVVDDQDMWDTMTATAAGSFAGDVSIAAQPLLPLMPLMASGNLATVEHHPSSSTSPSPVLPHSTFVADTQSTLPTVASQVFVDTTASTLARTPASRVASVSLHANNEINFPSHSATQDASGHEASAGQRAGTINIQALLDTLVPSRFPAGASEAGSPLAATQLQPTGGTPDAVDPGSPSTFPANPNLPPRPPTREKAATPTTSSPPSDVRPYPPHSQTAAAPAGFPSPGLNAAAPFRPSQGPGPAVVAAGAPGTETQAVGSLPPPPVATFQQASVAVGPPPQAPSPEAANFIALDPPEGKVVKGVGPRDEEGELPWNAELQTAYEEFVRAEKVYVSEGQWDRFPAQSRLFIGNLPSEKATKRDVFHLFQTYGRLAQISMKQAYGFVQFLDAESCRRALDGEQDQVIRGRKMHLEISKPQKNTRNAERVDQGANRTVLGRRRSRSPVHGRSGPRNPSFGRGGGGIGGSGGDRNGGDRGLDPSRAGRGGRERDRAPADRRNREDWRPAPRSPSPRARFRAGDDFPRRHGRERSRDRYAGGGPGRRNSRSRSPLRRGSGHPSPPSRWEAADQVDLLLPKRSPREVPDVQILLLDELDRNFVAFVDKAFRDRGMRTDVLFLSPRLPLDAVVRRQIVEGVQAIVRLDRACQATSKIPLQLFDRSGAASNVRFDEYTDLDPAIAAQLVIRAKQQRNGITPASTRAPAAVAAGYGAPPQPYGQALAYGASAGAGAGAGANVGSAAANVSSLISSLDGPGLQKLLEALQQQQPQRPHVPAPAMPAHHAAPTVSSTDLAALLQTISGGARAQAAPSHHHHQQPASAPSLMYPAQQAPPQQQQQPVPPQATNPYAVAASLASNPAFANNPALASLLAATRPGPSMSMSMPMSMSMSQPALQPQPQPQPQPHQAAHLQHHHHHQASSHHPPASAPASHVHSIMEQLAKWKQ